MGKYLLGVNNAWAVKRFAEPASWIEIAATRLEVDSVQFSLDLLDPSVDEATTKKIIDDILDLCKKYGVALHSCFTGLSAYSFNMLLHPYANMRKWALGWYSRSLVIASQLGVDSAGGHLGAMSSRDYDNPRRREQLLSELIHHIAELTQEARRLGLATFLWEPMPTPREPPSSVDETKVLLARVNKVTKIPVKLCIDVGHACNPQMKGTKSTDPYYWLSELGRDSPCIHIQQTDGLGDRHWPFTARFNKLGIIRPEKVMAALDRSGANNVGIFLEAVPAFEQPEKEVIRDISESMKYWKQFV